jgi:hypothetical protein
VFDPALDAPKIHQMEADDANESVCSFQAKSTASSSAIYWEQTHKNYCHEPGSKLVAKKK